MKYIKRYFYFLTHTISRQHNESLIKLLDTDFVLTLYTFPENFFLLDYVNPIILDALVIFEWYDQFSLEFGIYLLATQIFIHNFRYVWDCSVESYWQWITFLLQFSLLANSSFLSILSSFYLVWFLHFKNVLFILSA